MPSSAALLDAQVRQLTSLANNTEDGSQNSVVVLHRTETNELNDGTLQEAVAERLASLASLLDMVLQSPPKHQGKITSSASASTLVTLGKVSR